MSTPCPTDSPFPRSNDNCRTRADAFRDRDDALAYQPFPTQALPGVLRRFVEQAAAVLAAAADAAQGGAESTDALIARKGRASCLGERAVGHRDPGSVSSGLLLRAATEAAA